LMQPAATISPGSRSDRFIVVLAEHPQFAAVRVWSDTTPDVVVAPQPIRPARQERIGQRMATGLDTADTVGR
jgi:hypothetical protein